LPGRSALSSAQKPNKSKDEHDDEDEDDSLISGSGLKQTVFAWVEWQGLISEPTVITRKTKEERGQKLGWL
jgi:hypothetical protein